MTPRPSSPRVGGAKGTAALSAQPAASTMTKQKPLGTALSSRTNVSAIGGASGKLEPALTPHASQPSFWQPAVRPQVAVGTPVGAPIYAVAADPALGRGSSGPSVSSSGSSGPSVAPLSRSKAPPPAMPAATKSVSRSGPLRWSR